ncbi:hypothetical protein PHYSODRAFT_549577 [Phytophthora sojae]|uniref:Chitin-binding type-4 domain-containing protein n=1 Tax=Phytophthora sojae (strain P6497) TaxID=1094619 RepID=G5A5X4_PHYSP|nr:hypothetical protein PHYSODRAFT_549577 [Phytophthora sojae]EGZ08729.1 hypothetical protein PHYSODRAFT_549577 [Phytophthora sojae]|eukprot:XP_009535362.1 hypothetical protein PHYSODRAFT_549577 [Phytophthora sojae]
MKPAVFCTLAGTAIMMASTVDAHGQMLVPSYRPITAKYRQDCLFGLKGAGNDELQWAPIENLSQRGQADQPAAKTFDMYNGCRGLVYESGNNVTALTAGTPFEVQYYIQAPHPGVMKLSIVKPSTDSDGKITYKADTQVGSYSDFATSSGTFTVSATIPTTVTGCESAGDCALQFLWHSDIANQTYPTCADITISGSGAGTSTSTSKTTTATTAAPAAAATETTDDTEAAGEASYTADSTEASATDASADDTTQASGDDSTTPTSTDASGDDSTTPAATDAPTTTDAPATDAPEVTPAPETDSTKCSVRRVRRVRQ